MTQHIPIEATDEMTEEVIPRIWFWVSDPFQFLQTFPTDGNGLVS